MARRWFRYVIYIAVLPSVLLLSQCKKKSAAVDDVVDTEQETDGNNDNDNDGGGTPNPPNSFVAHHWKAGQVFFSDSEWAECIVGDMPLVLIAPHGGSLTPAGVPDRTCPNATTVMDLYTQEMAREIAAELYKEYGVRPYVVINRLHRRKIDLNREINEATCGNARMKEAWYDFHGYIDSTLATAVHRHGRALFIDLHGHTGAQVELGYRLNGTDLRNLSNGSNIVSLIAKSTMVNFMSNKSPAIFRDLIIGQDSFGSLLEDEGVPAIPGKRVEYPAAGASFFNGGYISDRYGSVNYPGVYGFQMECHRSIRDQQRPAFVKTFAKIVMQYLEKTKS